MIGARTERFLRDSCAKKNKRPCLSPGQGLFLAPELRRCCLWLTARLWQVVGLPHRPWEGNYMVASTALPDVTAAVDEPPRRLWDAKQLGARLGCSWRHVIRLADRGAMPWGIKLGSLRRWDAEEIERWI